MKKRMMSLALALAMCVSMCVPAFAFEIKNVYNEDSDLNIQIQNEIQQMEKEVWADLYNQLAAQDALDGIEYFQAALRPEIEQTIYEKHGVNYPTISASRSTASRSLGGTYTYSFPNGGMVTYNGTLNSEYVVLCMNPNDTLLYYYDHVSFSDYATAILGFVPGMQIIGVAGLVQLTLANMAQNEIRDADYYAKIISISWGSGAEQGTYGYGWSTHPSCTVYGVNQITSVNYGV